jgi:hypothetical protein
MEHAYRHTGYFLLVVLLIFIAGFWIPYFSQIPRFEASITVPVHIHAALLFGWLVLLIIQPLAIQSGAYRLHRTLGRISYVLAPFIVISAIAMIHKEYQAHLADGANTRSALAAEFLSIAQLALFTAMYCAAIFQARRRDIAAHMRYMICIVFVLLPAGLARTFGYWLEMKQSLSQTYCLIVIDVCLIGLIALDRSRRLPARPYCLALGAYVAVEIGWVALGRPT